MENDYTDLKNLIGKKVTGVFIDSFDDIYFQTDEGYVNFSISADCCSNSYIQHIAGIDSLIGQVVVGAWGNESPPEKNLDPDEVNNDITTFYLEGVTTAKGRFEIDFRNDSNGYYGGSIDYDGIKNELPKTAKQITEDF